MLLKILPINSYSNGAACNRPSKPVFGASYVNYGGVGVIDAPMDTFAISKKGSGIKAVRFYRIPTAKCPANRKFTLEDYKNLSESEKGFIMANIPDRTKGLASVNVKIGMAIKQTFDDTYGEGNYKFISLGTSPACAAKVLELMGADVVGMSTVPEAIVANWLKMRVLGISLISNYASGVFKNKLNHLEVIEAGKNASDKIKALLDLIIEKI